MITVTLPIDEYERLRASYQHCNGLAADLDKRIAAWHQAVGDKIESKLNSESLTISDKKTFKALLNIVLETKP